MTDQEFSSKDFMDAVREMYREWLEMSRITDPTIIALPDFEDAMDYAEAHGMEPATKTGVLQHQPSQTQDYQNGVASGQQNRPDSRSCLFRGRCPNHAS